MTKEENDILIGWMFLLSFWRLLLVFISDVQVVWSVHV